MIVRISSISPPLTPMEVNSKAIRPGVSLIEVLVVMSTLGIALTMGVLLINALLKTERAGGQAAKRLANRNEFATVFRADVARATARTDLNAATLTLTMPDDGTVDYRILDAGIDRVDHSSIGDHLRRIPLGGPGVKIEFLPKQPGLVTLRITELLPIGPPRITDIVAALAGDHR